MISSLCLDQHNFPTFLFEFIYGAEIPNVRACNNLFAFGEVCLSLYLKLIPGVCWDRQRGRQRGDRGEVRFKEGVEKNLRVGIRNVEIIQCMCNDD